MKEVFTHKHLTNQKAFTLIEMLMVIALMAILAGIVIIAINPGKQLAQARNAERAVELKSIFNASQQFYADNLYWPASTTIDSTLQEVCDENGEPSGSCLDMSELVPDYLSAIPVDPTATSGTDYYIALPSSNLLALLADNSTEYDLPVVNIGTTTSSVPDAIVCAVATGGDITYTDSNGENPQGTPYSDGYVVHTFTPDNDNVDFVVSGEALSAHILVVGGGGGGGLSGGNSSRSNGGGGGGGGYYENASYSIDVGTYDIQVGEGGIGGVLGGAYHADPGGLSSFDSLIEMGGGGDGGFGHLSVADNGGNSSGGSGGGAGAGLYGISSGGSSSAPSDQGNDGADGYTQNSSNDYGGGGGGAGADAVPLYHNGGAGRVSSISGESVMYSAGGGGGPVRTWNEGRQGGYPTYSAAGDAGNDSDGSDAPDGLGGGGGGASGYNHDGGDGGNGIIIIKYSFCE
jgi:prepilin-type N-terminal cleavage/methylation domain-containing protein